MPANTHDTSTNSQPNFAQPPTSSYVFQTVNTYVCINLLSCPIIKFLIEILILLCPHAEIAPNTEPFIVLTR